MARQDRSVTAAVAQGTARLVPDSDRARGWTLEVDGRPQSHVDLDDPTWIAFPYVRRLADVVDTVAPPRAPLDVVHLGLGAGTLARYVAATRPRSRQRAFEVDGPLVELVRAHLPLPAGLRVGTRDAAEGLASLRPGSADLVLGDVFAGGRTPAHLLTPAFAADVRRVVCPGGTWALNLGPDGAGHLEHLRAVWERVDVWREPGMKDGNRVVRCN